MRMWLVNPKLMCDKHLLGEHVEMHMFAGCIRKGMSLQGYIDKGLYQPGWIGKRHDSLAAEMQERGMNHKSPLELEETPIKPLTEDFIWGSIVNLGKRCEKCRELILEFFGKSHNTTKETIVL